MRKYLRKTKYNKTILETKRTHTHTHTDPQRSMSLKSAEVLRICLHIVWFQVAKTWITFKVFLFFNNEQVQHSQIGLFNSSARARLNENAKLDVKPTVSDPICVHKRTWELNSKGEEARKQIETWKNTKNNKTNHKRKPNKEPKQPENVTSSKIDAQLKKKRRFAQLRAKKCYWAS